MYWDDVLLSVGWVVREIIHLVIVVVCDYWSEWLMLLCLLVPLPVVCCYFISFLLFVLMLHFVSCCFQFCYCVGKCIFQLCGIWYFIIIECIDVLLLSRCYDCVDDVRYHLMLLFCYYFSFLRYYWDWELFVLYCYWLVVMKKCYWCDRVDFDCCWKWCYNYGVKSVLWLMWLLLIDVVDWGCDCWC